MKKLSILALAALSLFGSVYAEEPTATEKEKEKKEQAPIATTDEPQESTEGNS